MFDQPGYINTPVQAPPAAGRRSSLRHFQQARFQAALEEALGRLSGKPSQLLSFEEVTRRLHLAGRSERGVREIPLSAIVGSVGRYADFTRTFLPRHDSDQARWMRIKAAMDGLEPVALPPVDVYQVGEVYFVLDGNHRISVARHLGHTHIQARVIEVASPVRLTPDVSPDELIVRAEQAEFLEQTGLRNLPGALDLKLTAPGAYTHLREHIEAHRLALAQARSAGTVALAEAVPAWYADVYLPTVLALRERGVLRLFPNRTETDLYLWVTEHRTVLEAELGWAIRPDAALSDLLAKESPAAENRAAQPGAWRQARVVELYTDRLFPDVLVPLSGGPEGWAALGQALVIARRETARVHGLHVIAPEAHPTPDFIEDLRTRFSQRCAEAGVPGDIAFDTGDVARQICERALLADLVVLGLGPASAPAPGLASLGSRLRSIIWKCARPLLVVPGRAGPPDPLAGALLAYDGSPKAKEALFVAAYLAEAWRTRLRVMALFDRDRVAPDVLDYPRAYLELHEVQAEFELVSGTVAQFLAALATHRLDLLILGGYSVSAVQEVVGSGSAVNFLLRDTPVPLFICR